MMPQGRRNTGLGRENPYCGGRVLPESTPRPLVGEAYAHVQGESLKVYAALHSEASQLPDHQDGDRHSL